MWSVAPVEHVVSGSRRNYTPLLRGGMCEVLTLQNQIDFWKKKYVPIFSNKAQIPKPLQEVQLST
jgi:hypothetical protein